MCDIFLFKSYPFKIRILSNKETVKKKNKKQNSSKHSVYNMSHFYVSSVRNDIKHQFYLYSLFLFWLNIVWQQFLINQLTVGWIIILVFCKRDFSSSTEYIDVTGHFWDYFDRNLLRCNMLGYSLPLNSLILLCFCYNRHSITSEMYPH